MDSEKANWGLAEWKAHAEALEAALDSAMEGWGRTVDELEQSGKVLAKINEAGERQNSLLSIAVALAEETRKQLEEAGAVKRGRGRPKKITDDSWMIAAFGEWEADFKAANKYEKATDTNVINWAFEKMFARHNLPVEKVRRKSYQSKLKTFKNRLGDVRNPPRKTSR